MDKLELKSPAKINLFFRILNKRSDGYHEIESVYQAIDLFDRLFFSFSSSDEISCTDPTIPVDETNLIFKALKMFREKCDLPPIQIHLEKNIPVQAGLGGGSSNAATTLLGLNELMNFPLKKVELIELGKKIGSDVPFFSLMGQPFVLEEG